MAHEYSFEAFSACLTEAREILLPAAEIRRSKANLARFEARENGLHPLGPEVVRLDQLYRDAATDVIRLIVETHRLETEMLASHLDEVLVKTGGTSSYDLIAARIEDELAGKLAQLRDIAIPAADDKAYQADLVRRAARLDNPPPFSPDIVRLDALYQDAASELGSLIFESNRLDNELLAHRQKRRASQARHEDQQEQARLALDRLRSGKPQERAQPYQLRPDVPGNRS